jgi:hypothetical protein
MDKICCLLELHFKTVCFDAIRERKNAYHNLVKLMNKSEIVVKKQAFIKILNKMIHIKLKINNYNNKKQLIAKRFLF